MNANAFGSFGGLDDLARFGEGRSRRVSSWDRSGGNHDFITVPAGEARVLAEIAGTGVIRHIYMTVACGDRTFYRTTVLRMYWDGEESPSVEAPLGDFFGIMHAKPRCYASSVMSVNPGTTTAPGGGTHGLNCYFPMPFSGGARIEVENTGEYDLMGLWFHVDYEELAEPVAHQGCFHAQWRRENPTHTGNVSGVNLTGEGNYVLLDAAGRGHYVGCVLGVDNIAGGWFGEGDDMIFIDGEAWPPSLHGTGTEEVFGGGACPTREYAGPYSGVHLVSRADWAGKNGMYRWHVTDPVRFTKSIRVTIEHGHANNLANDYSSVAYWYQAEPHRAFPALPGREGLLPRLMDGFDTIRRRELLLLKWMNECFRRKRTLYLHEDQCRAEELCAGLNDAVDREDTAGAQRALDAMFALSRVPEEFRG